MDQTLDLTEAGMAAAQGLSQEDRAAAQTLSDKGWRVEPPEPDTWRPEFRGQFYEAAGDEPGTVYFRVDLPEGLYYSVNEAARLGLKAAEERLSVLEGIERALKERAQEQRRPSPRIPNAGEKPPAPVGILDGVQLEPSEVRALVMRAQDQVRQYRAAIDRLNPSHGR